MFVHDGSTTEPVPVEVRRTPQLTMSLGHISVAMSNLCSLTTRSTTQRTGSVVFSATDYRTLRCHSMFQVDHLVIQPIQQFSMDMVMDTEPMRRWISLTFVQDSGIQGAWKQVHNGTPQWITVPVLFPEVTKRLFGTISQKRTMLVGRYNYTNTSLPIGDYAFTGTLDQILALNGHGLSRRGSESDSFQHQIYA